MPQLTLTANTNKSLQSQHICIKSQLLYEITVCIYVQTTDKHKYLNSTDEV